MSGAAAALPGGAQAAPPGLDSDRTTVTPEWDRAFQEAYQRAAAPLVSRYASKASKATKPSTFEWARARREGARRGPVIRERDCAPNGRWVHCGCTSFEVGGCRQLLCKKCQRRGFGRQRRRILRAIDLHSRQRGYAWRLVTLSPPQRATPKETLDDLQTAWRRLRAWLHKRTGRRFPFVAVVEVGGRGGIHMHVVAQLPFVDFRELGQEWERAFPGAVSGTCDVQGRCSSGKRLARYAAKYASKGSELRELDADYAAELVVALHGRRRVLASQGFWAPPAPHCDACGVLYRLAEGKALAMCVDGLAVEGKRDFSRVLSPHWYRERLAGSVSELAAAEQRRAS